MLEFNINELISDSTSGNEIKFKRFMHNTELGWCKDIVNECLEIYTTQDNNQTQYLSGMNKLKQYVDPIVLKISSLKNINSLVFNSLYTLNFDDNGNYHSLCYKNGPDISFNNIGCDNIPNLIDSAIKNALWEAIHYHCIVWYYNKLSHTINKDFIAVDDMGGIIIKSDSIKDFEQIIEFFRLQHKACSIISVYEYFNLIRGNE